MPRHSYKHIVKLHSYAGITLPPSLVQPDGAESQLQHTTNLQRIPSSGALNPHSTLNRPSSARIGLRAQIDRLHLGGGMKPAGRYNADTSSVCLKAGDNAISDGAGLSDRAPSKNAMLLGDSPSAAADHSTMAAGMNSLPARPESAAHAESISGGHQTESVAKAPFADSHEEHGIYDTAPLHSSAEAEDNISQVMHFPLSQR